MRIRPKRYSAVSIWKSAPASGLRFLVLTVLRGITSIVFQNPEDQIVAAVVEEEAAFGPENLGCPTEEICRRVETSLKATGLWERRRDLVSSLSGGQKQRLALAGALAMRPQAILLDEALSMLDPRSRLEFTEIIKREHAKGVSTRARALNLPR